MNKVRTYQLLFFYLISVPSFGQHRPLITSNTEIIERLGVIDDLQNRSAPQDSITRQYDELLLSLNPKTDSVGIIETSLRYSRYVSGMGLYNAGQFGFLKQSLLVASHSNSLPPALLTDVHYAIGSQNFLNTRFAESINHLTKSTDIAKELSDSIMVMKNALLFIRIYHELRDTAKMKKSLITLESYLPEHNDLWYGTILIKRHDLSEVFPTEDRITLLKKAELLLEKSEPKNIHHSLNMNLAQYYLNANQPDSGKIYIEKIKHDIQNTPEYRLRFQQLNLLSIEGLYHFLTGDYEQAMDYFDGALQKCRDKNIPLQLRALLELMIKISSSKGDYKRSYEYHTQLKTINDSLLTFERIHEYENLLVKYESEKKEQTILSLEKEKQINDLVIERQKSSTIWLILLIIFLALIIVISVTFYVQKTRDSKKLIKLNELKDQFFSVLSHDLRTPIYSFRSLIQMGRRNYISEEEFQSFLDELQIELQSTSMLMESLLKWAESNQQTLKTSIEVIDLVQVIDEIIQLFHIDIESKSLNIQMENLDNSRISSDIELLKFILRNIISNAIRFSPVNGKISISVIHSRSETTIAISDEGKGLSNEQISSFHNGDMAAGEDLTGRKSSGLGLSLSKQFADILDIAIDISQNDPGTTFKLVLKKGD